MDQLLWAGHYQLYSMSIRPVIEPGNQIVTYALGVNGSVGYIEDFGDLILDLSDLDDYEGKIFAIYATSGTIRAWASETQAYGTNYFMGPESKQVDAFMKADGSSSQIIFAADFGMLARDCACESFAVANNKGSMLRSTYIATYPGRAPIVSLNSHAATGKRYNAYSSGTIDTGGAGPDFFPGSIAGTAESETYSWYK